MIINLLVLALIGIASGQKTSCDSQGVCSCKPGYYAPSGEAVKKEDDCEARRTEGYFKIEFTGGSSLQWNKNDDDFEWSNGAGWNNAQSYTPLQYGEFFDAIQTLSDSSATFKQFDGSTMVTVFGTPNFYQKGDTTGVTVKGIKVEYIWSAVDVSSPTTLLAELKEHIKNAIVNLMNDGDGTKIAKGSESDIVVVDLNDHPNWGEWGAYGTCGSDCTHTREKKCIDRSQLPCLVDSKDPWQETAFCESAECVAQTDNENTICKTGTSTCGCKAGTKSPTGLPASNKDCEPWEFCRGEEACGGFATCDDSKPVLECACEKGKFSRSGDPKTKKDCYTPRKTLAKASVEFTLGSDFWFEGEVFKFYNEYGQIRTGTLTGGYSRDEATQVKRGLRTILATPGTLLATSLLGSTSLFVDFDVAQFEKKDDTKVTVKGLVFFFDWGSEEIQSSPTEFTDDLVNHVTNGIKKLISDGANSMLFDNDSQDSVVVKDISDYPVPSVWTKWSTCDDTTCQTTRKKICYDRSYLPCKEETTPSEETKYCSSDKCPEYACKSEECWDFDKDAGTCTMKNECMTVTCGAKTMEIAVKSQLFGLATEEADKVAPQPDQDASDANGFNFKKSCKLGECEMTYKIVDTNLEFTMILREAEQDGFTKTVDTAKNALMVNQNPLAVAVKFTCKYPVAIELTSDTFNLKDVVLGAGPSNEGSLATGFELALDAGVTEAIKLGDRQEVKATWKVTGLKEVTFNFTECSVTQGTTEIALVKNFCFSNALKVATKEGSATEQAFSYATFSTVGATSTSQTMKCTVTICMDDCKLPKEDNECLGADETEFGAYDFTVAGYTGKLPPKKCPSDKKFVVEIHGLQHCCKVDNQGHCEGEVNQPSDANNPEAIPCPHTEGCVTNEDAGNDKCANCDGTKGKCPITKKHPFVIDEKNYCCRRDVEDACKRYLAVNSDYIEECADEDGCTTYDD